MKQPFLVGCLVFLLIVVGLVVFAGTQLWKQFQATKQQVESTSDALRAHNAAHPFTPPDSKEIAADQLDRVLKVREGVARPINDFLAQIAKGGVMDTIRASWDIVPTAANAFLANLKTQSMSSEEYLWVIDQVMAVVLRGKRPDASPEHKRLYQAYEDARMVKGRNGQQRPIEHGGELLERALAADVSATEETLILSRSDAIIASMSAVLGDSTLASIVEHKDRRPESGG